MDDVAANPVIIGLMFLARCLVPLIIMLGISYLLRRFGLIKEPPPPPSSYEEGEDANAAEEGGLVNG